MHKRRNSVRIFLGIVLLGTTGLIAFQYNHLRASSTGATIIKTATPILKVTATLTDLYTKSPHANVRLGNYIVTNTMPDSVYINDVSIDFTTASGSFTNQKLADVFVKVFDNKTGTLLAQTPAKSLVSSTGNTYSIGFYIPGYGKYRIAVFGYVLSGIKVGDSMRSALTANLLMPTIKSNTISGNRVIISP